MSRRRPHDPPSGGGGAGQLVPWTPPPPDGEGPRELWRRANAATRGTILGALLLLLLAGAFLAGRATAPEGDATSAARPPASAGRPDPARVAAARAQDATAKDAARSAVAFVESCAAATAERDYARCRTKAQLNVGSTPPLVDDGEPGAGQVGVSPTADGYRVVSVSASGNRFVLAQEGSAAPIRTCAATGVAGAGCVGGVW